MFTVEILATKNLSVLKDLIKETKTTSLGAFEPMDLNSGHVRSMGDSEHTRISPSRVSPKFIYPVCHS